MQCASLISLGLGAGLVGWTSVDEGQLICASGVCNLLSAPFRVFWPAKKGCHASVTLRWVNSAKSGLVLLSVLHEIVVMTVC